MPGPALVGITTSVNPDDYHGGDPPRAHLNRAYVLAIQQAGGIPILIPPYFARATLDALWDRLAALVLTGGGDIDPQCFAEPRHEAVDGVSEARDVLELQLAERAVSQGLPLLAICRGIQVLNVALGGSLHQHLPASYPKSRIAHAQQAPREHPTHDVKVTVEETKLGAVLGAPELRVNSFHHQAIKRLGRGLRDVAWAPDGVIEAVDMPEAPGLVMGVQWHPEDLVGRDPAARNLFTALVTASNHR